MVFVFFFSKAALYCAQRSLCDTCSSFSYFSFRPNLLSALKSLKIDENRFHCHENWMNFASHEHFWHESVTKIGFVSVLTHVELCGWQIPDKDNFMKMAILVVDGFHCFFFPLDTWRRASLSSRCRQSNMRMCACVRRTRGIRMEKLSDWIFFSSFFFRKRWSVWARISRKEVSEMRFEFKQTSTTGCRS